MDSTSNLDLVESNQASKEVTVNNLIAAGSIATAFGRHAEASAGLTWGYYGIRFGGDLIANGTLACVANSVNYMVMNLSTGAVSIDVATTNWNDTSHYGRCYLITTVGLAVDTWEDHRFGAKGIFGAGAGTISTLGTAAALDFDTDPTFAANSDARVPTQRAVNTAIAGQINGISNKPPVQAATTGALPANTYANGTLGVGATLTGNANGALAAQDGQTLALSDRLWVKNEVAGANNGIYALTQVGDGSHPYILTRATDSDTSAELAKASALVQAGTSQAKQVWTINNSGAITVGTTAISVVQTNTSAGDASTNTSVSVINEIALFADTLGKTLKRATASGYAFLTSGVLSAKTLLQLLADLQGDGLTSGQAGFRNIPLRDEAADYTFVAADCGSGVRHPSTDATPRTYTIPLHSSVAWVKGSVITVLNQRGAGNVTIHPATGVTLDFAGTASGAGDRVLAPNGWSTFINQDGGDVWMISGVNLT